LSPLPTVPVSLQHFILFFPPVLLLPRTQPGGDRVNRLQKDEGMADRGSARCGGVILWICMRAALHPHPLSSRGLTCGSIRREYGAFLPWRYNLNYRPQKANSAVPSKHCALWIYWRKLPMCPKNSNDSTERHFVHFKQTSRSTSHYRIYLTSEMCYSGDCVIPVAGSIR
jgi:hypothetical protein